MMKTQHLFLITSFSTLAQVAIGTTTPEGVLGIVSTNSGLIMPRVANITDVATPVNGLMIYDLSSSCLKIYGDGAWSECFGQSPVGVANAAASAAVLANLSGTTTLANLNATLPDVTGEDATEGAYQDYITNVAVAFSSPAHRQRCKPW
tara:strand:+ start:315 stop:761 length:447 start_codon:yes stop_codon:yes gene_type:complete